MKILRRLFNNRANAKPGASLLELMLAMAVFATILPFAYRFALEYKERAENAATVRRMEMLRSALSEYIADNRRELLTPMGRNITRVKLSDLKGLPKNGFAGQKIQLRIIKSKDIGGRAFVQGIMIFDDPSITLPRARKIALAAGASAGFADGRVMRGAYGTWSAPAAAIDAVLSEGSIIMQTKTFKSGGDYLRRLPGGDPLDAAMATDIFMGLNNIANAKSISATAARFLERLNADTLDASKMTVKNRLDWAAPMEVFGGMTVAGAIAADGRSVKTTSMSVGGRSQFRAVTTKELRAENLYLAGFSVSPGDAGTGATILSVSGTLDMTRGHIKAIDSSIGFSGSVAPKLIVNRRIEDAENSEFYWNLQEGDALLGDLQLSELAQMMRRAYNAERGGNTETERLMAPVAANANATVSDYLRALEQVRRAVEAKYDSIK